MAELTQGCRLGFTMRWYIWRPTCSLKCPFLLSTYEFSHWIPHGSNIASMRLACMPLAGGWDAFGPHYSNGMWFSSRASMLGSSSLTYDSSPVSFFWQQYNVGRVTPAQGSCTVHNTPLVIASSALNTGGDIVIFALPIAMLWRLQLKRSHKAALILVFATGAL